MLGLSAPDALDAYLVTGGLPLIADEWPTGMPMWEYLSSALSSSTSALVVSGERMLAAERQESSRTVVTWVQARCLASRLRVSGGAPRRLPTRVHDDLHLAGPGLVDKRRGHLVEPDHPRGERIDLDGAAAH